MSSKLKVWGGADWLRGVEKKCRVIVAATTAKQAAALIGCSATHLRNWYSETGNPVELEVASEQGVWYAPYAWKDRTTADYTPYSGVSSQ